VTPTEINVVGHGPDTIETRTIFEHIGAGLAVLPCRVLHLCLHAMPITLALVTCACNMQGPQEELLPEDRGPVVTTEPECYELGGTWVLGRGSVEDFCMVPTSDEGKTCRDHSECESVCVAPEGAELHAKVTGTCYGSYHTLGTCLPRVKAGRFDGTLCVD
jgi:hypothetical protein